MSRYLNKTNLWPVLGVIVIIAIGVFIRLTVYGDLRLSVANLDTPSYVESSEVNPLSWGAFTRQRQFTTNLVYRIFTPNDGYRYRAISSRATGTITRKIDRGFEDIAVLQSTLSIVAWICLAWSFASRLKSGIARIASAGLIILFGFTPQIADWDSVLSAESLSISLFILSFATLIWLAFAYYEQPINNTMKTLGFGALLVALFFWIFVRDVNTYSLIFLLLLILGIYIVPRFRKTKFFLLAAILICLLLALGQTSTGQRRLRQGVLVDVWATDIQPFPAIMQYFHDKGMPEEGTPEFSIWFNEHAALTYFQFLFDHPAYTTNKFFKDLPIAFEDNVQPYFKANDLKFRSLLLMVGDYLHPKNATIFFIVVALLLVLLNHAIFQGRPAAYPWAWVMTWAFLTASATMFFSIFGDSWGLLRHALSSTATYRLLTWMLLLIIFDFSLVRAEREPPPLAPSESKVI